MKWKRRFDENLGISEEAFKKLIKNLAKIDKLVQKAALKEEPGIDEDKTYEKFLNEYKSIPLAYWNFLNIYAKDNEDILTFEALAAAKDFYQRIKREAGFWDDRKREDPKEFKRPGFVALDFLLNMWGFDRKAAYEMLDKELNTYYPPATIYKGYGVFKILKIRKADPAEFEKRKEYYYGRVKEIKKYKQYNDWVEKLKAEANIKRYIQ
ncbi:MAG: hypothetical protein HY810_03560 [Candidatus Omnitrophica bacterium]|nr:hypothetical protein [Candidatus Omnitrophota bacterium]